MKKLVAILLSMLLILSLISCNKGEVKSGEEAKTETVEVKEQEVSDSGTSK